MNNVAQLFPIEETRPEANRFDEFWAACPLKKKKAATRAKYNAILSNRGHATKTLEKDSGGFIDIHLKATEDELIDGIKKYAMSVSGNRDNNYKRSEFILHPLTWLNQGRWEDE